MSPQDRLLYCRYITFSNDDTSLFVITYHNNQVNGYLLHTNTRIDQLQFRSNHIPNYNLVDLFYLDDKSIVILNINVKRDILGGYCDRITP